ncbi:TPA: hypothetical protein PXM11_001466 [Yersinia enterocolitica]|uniref:Tox-PL domain-containing protein n=1 Tax=Yersinia enterocolitica TaxID=630 RepID=A0ABM9S2U5_YEREN|nr:hypothetical protein [Yersinia enterocolitica]CND99208.1 Uncharacterised protein [Yersinia enterocolitica]CNF89848.1 Uncharacterised protein [Yersinia enterocolitica]CQD65421.1 Uncharacterised protein [Yersinia enterocolitica]CRX80597.1 Uncharacterised protein [Yersinia enterocolitica]HDL6966040.1 hypothetical protein [Yersinia enterocolitica]
MRISEIDYAGWGPDSSQECNQSERKSLLSLHSSESLYTESFDDVDGNRYGNLDSYTPPILALANKEDSYGIKPSNYSCFGTKEAYLKDFLLNRINSKGVPPLLLRPLAALLELFGIYGFGQTNCASCATAVAKTLEKNKVYTAIPNLRGADVKGNMGLPFQSAESASELISQLDKYQTADELNGVLVIHRPAMMRMLPGATQGHSCNVIKFKDSKFIHFFDAQKRNHVVYDLRIDKQIKPLNEKDMQKLSSMETQVKKFLGFIGDQGIDIYQTGMHEDINKRAEFNPGLM